MGVVIKIGRRVDLDKYNKPVSWEVLEKWFEDLCHLWNDLKKSSADIRIAKDAAKKWRQCIMGEKQLNLIIPY